MARMDADTVGSTSAKMESELARVQHALAVVEEARWNAEDKASRLADERVSLLLELGTCKDEVSTIRVKALKKKEDLREAYEEGFDVIFNYRYGCCDFTHNICGSQPEVPDGMPGTSKSLSKEFFINPRCPPGTTLAEVVSIFVHSGEATNAPERKALAAVLESDDSEAGEHLSATEVEPDSSARITRKVKEPDVSGGN